MDLGFKTNQYKVITNEKLNINFNSNALILYINYF